jgi:methylated-DNA-[protein]-cysteine S-methyltransferase
MDTYETAYIASPLGEIEIRRSRDSLTSLSINSGQSSRSVPVTDPILERAVRQLSEYFSRVRTQFDLPLSLSGTPFQMEVWKALEDIPYGHTVTYGELAEKIGRPGSARAVGGAVGSNPLPIVIPCHRVMGSSGAITGYSAGDGIPTKKALLDLEGISYR